MTYCMFKCNSRWCCCVWVVWPLYMFHFISSMAIYSHCYNNSLRTYYNLCDSVVEHPHLKQEVVGSNPGRHTRGVKSDTIGYLNLIAWCSAL